MAGPKSHRGRRNKGAAGEREFFAVLNRYLPENLRLKRMLGQARDGGADGKSGKFEVEVKRQENLRLNQWLKQARQAVENPDAVENRGKSWPVVAYRKSHEPWRCLIEVSPLELAAIMRCRQDIDSITTAIKRAAEPLDDTPD